LHSINFNQFAAFAIIRDQGRRLLEVNLDPVLHSFRFIIITLIEFRAIEIADVILLWRVRLLIENVSAIYTTGSATT
jgi:hypothetical protein